jgi:acetate kinase
MDAILVVNAGSSSLKFQVFEVSGGELVRRVRGQIDGIGVRPRLRAVAGDGAELVDRSYAADAVADLPAAIVETRDWLRSLGGFQLRAIGHRVVHGGPDFAQPVLIDATVLDRLAAFQELAPLHQPNNLAPIRRAMEIDASVPQVACFDTAFHRGHPPHADCYALPRAFYAEGIRRYGFHGLSYEYVAERLRKAAPDIAGGRVVVAHLGSGASMCALKDGHSVESTMGFTALDGLPMGTRPGQLDPGVVLYLIAQRGMSAAEVSDLLYRESGLKGLSGISNDLRDLLASDDERAVFAIDHFVHRCALHAGQLAAALDGLDAFVFTAGVGENSVPIRARIAERLAWLGAVLDGAANAAGAPRISSPASRVALLVIPTDEELMIARHTLALVGASVRSRSTGGRQ